MDFVSKYSIFMVNLRLAAVGCVVTTYNFTLLMMEDHPHRLTISLQDNYTYMSFNRRSWALTDYGDIVFIRIVKTVTLSLFPFHFYNLSIASPLPY
jgi:hypothetical protein